MKPGDEVICVGGPNSRWQKRNARVWRVTLPVVGQKYTIRDICRAAADKPHVLLEEITNPEVNFIGGGRGEASFPVNYFRVIDKEQERLIETFTIGAGPDSEQWDNRRKVPAEA